MDLQLFLKSPSNGPFYMPGEDVNGWVKCRSSCFGLGTKSAMKTICVNLVGECCTFITDDNKLKRIHREEIMNHSVLLYSAGDPQYELPSNASEFVKLAFTLVVAEHSSADLNISAGKNTRISLPSSFSDEQDAENRYIRYWVAISGVRADGGKPFIDQETIRVMSWDPESRKPQLELPRLLSSSPYVLPAPGDEWRVVMHWTPLRFTTHKRKDFYTKPVPKDHNSGKSLMFCNECRVPIQGPRFVCCDCQVAVNWCWACISNSKKAHPNGHVFVRIEKSSNSQDCIQKNLAAKSLVFRAKQKKKTHSKGNTVVQVTSEATHVFWLPNREGYPHGVAVPLLMTVKISSDSRSVLSDLRPILPWDNTENTTGRINEKRSGLWLSVALDSTVESRKDSTPWRHRSMWLDNGMWLSPVAPSDSSGGPKTSFSCDWSPPIKNEADQWVQSAAVCSSIKRVFSYDKRFDEPQINLRSLQTRFKLCYKQKMAGIDVEINISETPWTSGMYKAIELEKNASSVVSHLNSLSLTKPIPAVSTPIEGAGGGKHVLEFV